jgi:tetratricopeptide (TPR) repeat protein
MCCISRSTITLIVSAVMLIACGPPATPMPPQATSLPTVTPSTGTSAATAATALNDPALVESRYSEANTHLSQDDYDAAIADYTIVIQANTVHVGAYCNRGKAYLNSRFVDRAIADWDKAIALKPDYAQAYYNRGLGYILEGRDDRGTADLDKAAELKLDYSGLYALRALIRQLEGDLDRAIADWDKAIQLQPNLAMAYSNRGLAYHDTGDLDSAITDWGKAIELQSAGAAEQHSRESASDRADLNCAVAVAEWENLIRPAPRNEVLYELRESATRALQELTSVAATRIPGPAATPAANWCAPADVDEFTAVAGGNAGANWAVISEFVFPANSWAAGKHTYTFWFGPCPYSGELPDHLTRSFVVTNEASLYDAIYLGPLGPGTSGSAYGPLIEAIHPSQPTIARLNDIQLTQAEAEAVARECVNWITWDDGDRHPLVPRAPCQYTR